MHSLNCPPTDPSFNKVSIIFFVCSSYLADSCLYSNVVNVGHICLIASLFVKVYQGLKVMCTDNLYKKEMYNGELYTVDKFQGSTVFVNGQEFNLDEFSKKFIVAYCITSHKYQGDEINEPYNIFDVDKMTANELYVAISRTTRFEFVHLDASLLKKKYFFHDFEKEENTTYNCTKNKKYGNGKIYKITTKDNKVYIGSTTDTIKKRREEHIKEESSPLYAQKDCTIELIAKCNCFSRKELEAVEKKFINKALKEEEEE